MRSFFFGLAVVAFSGVAVSNYSVDPAHSSVGFSVKHLGISNVHGKFKVFGGDVAYDERQTIS